MVNEQYVVVKVVVLGVGEYLLHELEEEVVGMCKSYFDGMRRSVYRI